MLTKQESQRQPEEFVKKGKKKSGKNDHDADDKKKKHTSKKMACKMCKKEGKTSGHSKHKGGLKLNPPSKGHKPKGAHGRAAVRALGRTKTTGNFDKIEKAKGKGAAIMAYQNALKAHNSKKKKASGKEMLGKAMKRLNH